MRYQTLRCKTSGKTEIFTRLSYCFVSRSASYFPRSERSRGRFGAEIRLLRFSETIIVRPRKCVGRLLEFRTTRAFSAFRSNYRPLKTRRIVLRAEPGF